MTPELTWDTYSVWPDLLEHLKGRLQENSIFNEVQVLQIQ